MYYVDFILNYPNRCIIGDKNLMTIVWKIRIYYYLRCNILMLRLICDHWFLMIDKCGVYVRVSRDVSITAGITSAERAQVAPQVQNEKENELSLLKHRSLFVLYCRRQCLRSLCRGLQGRGVKRSRPWSA